MIESLLAGICVLLFLILKGINRLNRTIKTEIKELNQINKEVEAILRKEANKNK